MTPIGSSSGSQPDRARDMVVGQAQFWTGIDPRISLRTDATGTEGGGAAAPAPPNRFPPPPTLPKLTVHIFQARLSREGAKAKAINCHEDRVSCDCRHFRKRTPT